MKNLSIEKMEQVEGGWSWVGCAAGAAASSVSGIAGSAAGVGAAFGPAGAAAGYFGALAFACVVGGSI
ncbi:hypothetical protein [Marivirga harenae]|uniref:hypothetical protein n=1 Tax=Marivirga harenae TaxID=2010992 RepID=UPI0026DFB024|nr:hypothetical protein [Marivirga harenae]WKV13452.1 hypothetical protein Q3Y49_06385 [Marivirga harenae]